MYDTETAEYHNYLDDMASEQTATEAADEFFNRKWEVHCDLCGSQSYATENDLRQMGWELTRGAEFCPSH